MDKKVASVKWEVKEYGENKSVVAMGENVTITEKTCNNWSNMIGLRCFGADGKMVK